MAPRDGVRTRFRALALEGSLDLPLPGSGRTWERWQRLASLTAADVSLGRLCEGHADALAILAEAGHPAPADAVLGVWAAEGPGSGVEAEAADGALLLRGRRAYCSGARTLTHALLAVRRQGRRRLVLLELDGAGLRWEPDSWPATGMAATESLTLRLDEVREAGDALVGDDDFYVDRAGFWMGAMGVAACWWGGALSVARAAASLAGDRREDAYRMAQLGRTHATLEATRALLQSSARQCDEAADVEALHLAALTVRAQTARACGDVLDAARGLLGSAPLCHDEALGRRVADLYVYVSQFREGAELAELGSRSLDRGSAG